MKDQRRGWRTSRGDLEYHWRLEDQQWGLEDTKEEAGELIVGLGGLIEGVWRTSRGGFGGLGVGGRVLMGSRCPPPHPSSAMGDSDDEYDRRRRDKFRRERSDYDRSRERDDRRRDEWSDRWVGRVWGGSSRPAGGAPKGGWDLCVLLACRGHPDISVESSQRAGGAVMRPCEVLLTCRGRPNGRGGVFVSSWPAGGALISLQSPPSLLGALLCFFVRSSRPTGGAVKGG